MYAAYMELSKPFGELHLSFGICYGGEAGEGALYTFTQVDGSWNLTGKPELG